MIQQSCSQACSRACMLNCFSCDWLFWDPVDCSLPDFLSMGFSRQEYWSGLSCPPPGDLPNPGIKPLMSPALQVDSLPLSYQGSSLLGIYPDKTLIQNDTCTPMFIAALFTIAKTWKQPKCPSINELIKMWYIYTVEYFSVIKKEIMPFAATWIQLEIIILSEIRQKEKDNYYVIWLICGI